MVNKKGADQFMIIIGLVVAVLLLVLFGVMIAKGYGLADVISVFTPKTSVDSLAQNCNTILGTTPANFCEFNSLNVNGRKQYVNCRFPGVLDKLESGDIPSCVDAEKTLCEQLKEDKKDMARTYVNDKVCGSTEAGVTNWGVAVV